MRTTSSDPFSYPAPPPHSKITGNTVMAFWSYIQRTGWTYVTSRISGFLFVFLLLCSAYYAVVVYNVRERQAEGKGGKRENQSIQMDLRE